MNYKTFEELPCWQKARELCKEVFKIINERKFQKDYSLKDQIWRAGGAGRVHPSGILLRMPLFEDSTG